MKNKKDVSRELKISPEYEYAFGILGKKWQALIIDILYQKNCTFSEIARAIHMMSGRMLTERLKELESQGIVYKLIEENNTKKFVYGLTEKGRTLADATQSIKDWAKKWM